jgi:hypothetical protein
LSIKIVSPRSHNETRVSLTLEFLLRATLANYSPALLADTKDVNNLYSAVGIKPKAARFSPKSIGTKEVIDRLNAIVMAFQNFLDSAIAIPRSGMANCIQARQRSKVSNIRRGCHFITRHAKF